MNALGVLIFASLILATLQEGSPEVTSFELLTASILALVFLGGATWFLISHREIPKPLFYLFGFLVWAGFNAMIAIANNVEPLWWFRRFFPVVTFSLTALASMMAFRSERKLHKAFVTLVFILIMMVALSLLQIRLLDLNTIANLQELRKYGGGYYSAFGLCLVAPLLFWRPQLKGLTRFLVLLGSGVLFIGLILSFTRTYWISTCVALLFMVYLLALIRGRSFFVLLVQFAMPAVLVLAFSFLSAPSNIREFVASRVLSILQFAHDLSFQDRITELQGLWSSATKEPLSVLGGNGFGAKFTFYSVNPWSWGGTGWIENDYSHNYYAYLFWSTGLTGLALFLLFWISMLRQAIKILQRASNIHGGYPHYLIGICTAGVNLMVASLTGPPLMDFKWAVYFGILVGIAFNLMASMRRRTPCSWVTGS